MSADGKEHFIQTLHVHDAYAVRDLDIPIGTPEGPRHLLLTGPNGSGKSTILRRLAMNSADAWNLLGKVEKTRVHGSEGELAAAYSELGVSTTPRTEPRWKDNVLYYAGPSRQPQFPASDGPGALPALPHETGPGHESLLLQFLVNLRTEAALAREEGDDDAANSLSARLGAFESSLKEILDDPALRLDFDRRSWNYTLVLGDGRTLSFDQLPDGFKNLLHLWSRLLIAAEALRGSGFDGDVPGWAIIDEPETHLHASLQEQILPFLARSFPRVQFIVATHSPAVLASLPNATVFDLRIREAYPSEELRGVRYGTILTEHFGISSDFDLETTRALKELYGLYEKNPQPGSDDFKKMRELADTLGEVPHILVPATKKLTSRASDE